MTAIKKECRSGVEDKWPVVDENCNSNKAAVYRNNNTQNNGALVKYVSVHSERIHETVQSYFCCTFPPSRPNIATLYIYIRAIDVIVSIVKLQRLLSLIARPPLLPSR